MLLGFLFVVSFVVISIFIWQAMADSWKTALRNGGGVLLSWAGKGGKVGLGASTVALTYLRQPRTLAVLVPAIIVVVALWWGAESNPWATGNFLAVLTHPPLLIGCIIVLVWLNKSEGQIDQGFLRKIGLTALIWALCWYWLSYIIEMRSNTILLVLTIALTIAAQPLAFAAAVALVTWKDKSGTLFKHPFLKGVAAACILWTGLGFVAQYIGTKYIPNASAETLNHIRVQYNRPAVEISNIRCELYDTKYDERPHPRVRMMLPYVLCRYRNETSQFNDHFLLRYNRELNTWRLRTDDEFGRGFNRNYLN